LPAIVRAVTSRKRVYAKDFKREKLIKIKDDIDVDSFCKYQFIYNLIKAEGERRDE